MAMAAAGSNNTTVLRMKLLVDTRVQRVLFAEASKAGATRAGRGARGPRRGKFHRSSAETQGRAQAGAAKDELLRPTIISSTAISNSSLLRLPEPASSGQQKAFYRCCYHGTSSCYNYVMDVSGTSCPSCGRQMTTVLHYTGKPVQNVSTGGAKGVWRFSRRPCSSKTVLTDVFLGNNKAPARA
ncbi:hypothetical protein PR202_ga23439 [Eleusine coracana subsp. coracana]|uniref:Uncharacterized protein n=1 Tax=Eleusine coracana subsp. coracana TaxID=191504 RepID=A0AAV5D666_ELECO|nr:hypothetical protein PR202_ga23439 [Eleusine coracana subsp. coracana]